MFRCAALPLVLGAFAIGGIPVQADGDTVGLYDPDAGAFVLRFDNTDGPADTEVTLQGVGHNALPVAGDWDGDGIANVGAYQRRSARFRLSNRNASGRPELNFHLRGAGSGSGLLPVAGDWDGDGRDTIGVYDRTTGGFQLWNADYSGPADLVFRFPGARKSWLPIAGDWDGDGLATVGLFEPRTAVFHLRNQNRADAAEFRVRIDEPGDDGGWLPVAGDWDGDGITTVGRFHARTGVFQLRDRNSDGRADRTLVFQDSAARARPIAGRWREVDGFDAAQICVETINAYRAALGLAPLTRWIEAERCADGQAASDASTGRPHGAFGSCGELAQNECPNWPGPPERMIEACLGMMWDEGPGEDFSRHGHYLNMSSTRYAKVSCGFSVRPDGTVWSVQDFR